MSKAVDTSPTALREWHLGAMNDGLFIVDAPPRPSTDDIVPDREDGPTMILNVTDLPEPKARAIVTAHNATLRTLRASLAAAEKDRDEADASAEAIEAKFATLCPTALRTLAGAATPGPWQVATYRTPFSITRHDGTACAGEHVGRDIATVRHHPQFKGPYPIVTLGIGVTQETPVPFVHIRPEDADYLAAVSPEVVLALLDEIAALRARRLILEERLRQIEMEGWSVKHDDEHDDGEMLSAAIIYLHWGTDKAPPLGDNGAPVGWPWAPSWFKPRSRLRNLVRAGALCLAERLRLMRAGRATHHVWHKYQLVLDALTEAPPS